MIEVNQTGVRSTRMVLQLLHFKAAQTSQFTHGVRDVLTIRTVASGSSLGRSNCEEGRYGKVVTGAWVAIKVINIKMASSSYVDQFPSLDLDIIKTLNHPNTGWRRRLQLHQRRGEEEQTEGKTCGPEEGS